MNTSPVDTAKNRRDAALRLWRRKLHDLKLCDPRLRQRIAKQIGIEKAKAEFLEASKDYLETLLREDSSGKTTDPMAPLGAGNEFSRSALGTIGFCAPG